MSMQPDPAVAQELAGIKSFMEGKFTVLEEEVQRMAGTLTAGLKASKELRRDALLNSLKAGRQTVLVGKYAGMDFLDLAVSRSLLRAQEAKSDGIEPSMLANWSQNLKAAMDSTTSAAGDELVDTQEARTLWEDVNLETAVASRIQTITMPSNPFQIPLQLGDMNWYPGTENVAAKSTNASTGRQTLTAYELVAEVPWSYDLDEDSVISMMEELRRSLQRNAAEIIDDVVLNGDTTVTNGINSDGATIAPTDAGKAQWLLGFDGLIHLPLIDNTNQANNHNEGVTDDMFNEIRSKLGRYGVRPSEATFVTDIKTFIRSLGISNVRTLDQFGPQATILTGQLAAVEAIPLIVSEQMLLTASDGKVTDGVAGTVGRLLIVNGSQWRIGFKRELTIETVRDPQKRQNIMVVSFRIALQERSGNRSSATHTALQYNITGL
ncbi:MAG: phage major capsid protein [Dehalococcoidia bacterium]